MQSIRNVYTSFVEDSPRIIPAKFGEYPFSSVGVDVV